MELLGLKDGRDSVGLEQATGQRSNQLNYVPTAKSNDLR